MFKRNLLLSATIVLALLTVSCTDYTVIQLTENIGADWEPQINDNGWVVWSGQFCTESPCCPWWDVLLYDGTRTTRLEQGLYSTYPFRHPQISNNGRVVWQDCDGGMGEYCDGGDLEVFFYDGTTTRLTDNSHHDQSPQISNNGHVVWSGYDGSDTEIFLYDGTIVTQLTNNGYDDELSWIPEYEGGEWPSNIDDNGHVVWQGDDGSDWEIFLYDGLSITQLINNGYDDRDPQINNNGHVVWRGCDGTDCWGGIGDWEIFLYDGISTRQLTNNAYHDEYPRMNDNGHVVWQGCDGGTGSYCDGGDFEVFLYDGTTTIQLTNNDCDDEYPQINDNGWVVWVKTVYLTDDLEEASIYLYNGTSTTQIGEPEYLWIEGYVNLVISDNGYVVWTINGQLYNHVYLYDGANTISLNGPLGQEGLLWADINDSGEVVWSGVWTGDESGDEEIFLFARPTGYSSVANAEAAAYGPSSLIGSGIFNSLGLLLVPLGGVVLLRILRRKR